MSLTDSDDVTLPMLIEIIQDVCFKTAKNLPADRWNMGARTVGATGALPPNHNVEEGGP